MMPSIEVCIYCSHKIEEKEKSVNLPAGVAHLACPKGNDPNEDIIVESGFPISVAAGAPWRGPSPRGRQRPMRFPRR
jgi:hypothetical protein